MQQALESISLAPPGVRTVQDVSFYLTAFSRAIQGMVRQMGYRVNRVLPKDGTEAMSGPLVHATYTVATRPAAASYTGGVIYVSDGGAGAVFQGSNGAAWVNLG